jgi:hypothetical protein
MIALMDEMSKPKRPPPMTEMAVIKYMLPVCHIVEDYSLPVLLERLGVRALALEDID